MKEYEYRRTCFYQMNAQKDFLDNHQNFEIILSPKTTVSDAVEYLTTGKKFSRFPGAARAVAIATANFVSISFNEDFFETLKDSNLMHGNDPYFKTYDEDKETYDSILSLVTPERINWSSYRMQITLKHLLEEYMLDSEGLKVLPIENKNHNDKLRLH